MDHRTVQDRPLCGIEDQLRDLLGLDQSIGRHTCFELGFESGHCTNVRAQHFGVGKTRADGTGIGMSMVANKVKGVRAALCHDVYTAMMARQHNNANVLCMGARVLTPYQAINIARTFFETDFLGGRHEDRVKMID